MAWKQYSKSLSSHFCYFNKGKCLRSRTSKALKDVFKNCQFILKCVDQSIIIGLATLILLLIFGMKCDRSLHVFSWFQLQEGVIFLNVVFSIVLLTQLYHTFVSIKLSLGQIWGDQSYEDLLCQNICTLRCAAGSQVSHWEINMVFNVNRDFSNTLTAFKSKPRRYYFHCTDNDKLPYKVKIILYIWECMFKREM